MSNFVIQIQDLDELGKDWSFSLSTGWLSVTLADTGLRAASDDGQLELHAQLSGQDVLLQGHLDVGLLAECARCLGDVAVDVHLDIVSLLSPEHMRPAEAEGEEVEVSLDAPNRDYYSGSQIVLDPMVREYLLLELPMKPLCKEECKGIAVPEHLQPPAEVFGSATVDARLAPLLKLKKELSEE